MVLWSLTSTETILAQPGQHQQMNSLDHCCPEPGILGTKANSIVPAHRRPYSHPAPSRRDSSTWMGNAVLNPTEQSNLELSCEVFLSNLLVQLYQRFSPAAHSVKMQVMHSPEVRALPGLGKARHLTATYSILKLGSQPNSVTDHSTGSVPTMPTSREAEAWLPFAMHELPNFLKSNPCS